MIKINLAARKRSAAVSGSGGATGTLQNLSVGSLMGRLEELKELSLKKALIPLAIGVAAGFASDMYQDGELKKLDAEIASSAAEKPKLEAEAAKMKGYEALKKSMEADEFVIKTKLETIQKLIKGRADAPKIMADLSKVTPPSIWLTEFSFKGGNIIVKGNSSSFRHVSPFLKTLNEDPFFRDLTLKDSQTQKDPQGREMVSFELSATEAKK